MNTDILKDLSKCRAVVDAFVIDHYGDLLKIVDMAKDDGAKHTGIEDLIEALLIVGYESGIKEMNRRNPQCTIEDISKP